MDKEGRIWTEQEARAFLGKRIKDLNPRYPTGSNGVPVGLPDQIRFMKLESPKVREALQACATAEAGDIVLIIGPGGSGKSVIYRAVAHSVGKALCLAPTGVAALNLQADGWLSPKDAGDFGVPVPATINSGLGVPITDYLRVSDAYNAADKVAGGDWTHILVDEVSMVSPNMLDVLLHVADLLQVPLILFGDPMQLPPVERSRKSGSPSMAYPSWRFFSSYGWMLHDEDRMRMIVLDSIYRQDDPGFKSMLNRARIGELTPEDEIALRRRTLSQPDDDALILCFRNDMAQKMNAAQTGRHFPTLHCSPLYQKILGEKLLGDCGKVIWDDGFKNQPTKASDLAVFLLPHEGGSPDRFAWEDVEIDGKPAKVLKASATVQERLVLYPGDRVMITRNMTVSCTDGAGAGLYDHIMGKKGFVYPLSREGTKKSVVNGSMGTYLGMANALASRESWWLEIPSGKWDSIRGMETAQKLAKQPPEEDEYLIILLDDGNTVFVPRVSFCSYETDKSGDSYETEEVVQFPVRLSYAITYHKSQGLTLNKVHMILDPKDPMPPGLGYLGISRCRSLEGLTLNMYTRSAFECDRLSKDFLRIMGNPHEGEAEPRRRF